MRYGVVVEELAGRGHGPTGREQTGHVCRRVSGEDELRGEEGGARAQCRASRLN